MNTIMITGAGAGIGRETARLYAGQGWFVGLFDLDGAALRTLHAELGADKSAWWSGDVTDEASLSSALERFALRTDGRMDVFLNNAGILRTGAFVDVPLEHHLKTIAINAAGLTQAAWLAHPWLKATPGATLVNMSSASALQGVPMFAVYSATKAYVRALTEALHLEWAEDDIRVIDILPPFVNTGMLAGVSPALTAGMGVSHNAEDIAKAIAGAVASGRLHTLVGLKLKFISGFSAFAPDSLRLAIMRRIMGTG